MLKVKLQYFGHLMRKADSLEKTLMLGKIEGRRRRGLTEDEMVGWHQFSSVAQLCPILCDPMDCSTLGFLVLHYLLSLLKLMSIKSVMPPNHLIPRCPLFLLPSIFPTIRVFSSESALCIRWPKYWCFSFSISPSNEYSGLISFRIDNLLPVQ